MKTKISDFDPVYLSLTIPDLVIGHDVKNFYVGEIFLPG